MKKLIMLIYWILLPALYAYLFLSISAEQLGVEAAQRTVSTRFFLVIFITLFLWATGNVLLGGWKPVARFWESLGVLGYQKRSLFNSVSIALGTLVMLCGFALMISNAVTEYLPSWIIYRPLIVGLTLIVEVVGLSKYALDVLNTGRPDS